MDGYKAYRYYLAIKLHFGSDKFDVFQNHGAVKYSREKFDSRNDKYIFEKLSKKFKADKEYIQFLASNFMYGNPDVVYTGSDADDNYIEFQRRKQSITKIFSDDCDIILRESEKINFTNNQIPFIISLYLSSRITLETLRIFDDSLDTINNLKMENQTLYDMFDEPLRVVSKSKGFVKYDSEKTTPIMKNLLLELEANNHEQHSQETQS